MSIENAKLETLGHTVRSVVPKAARTILLYVEFWDDGVVSPSLFYDLADGTLHYVESDHAISHELFHLQNILSASVKAMEFAVAGERFDGQLVYADQFDASTDTTTRADAVLQRRFGHASVSYKLL